MSKNIYVGNLPFQTTSDDLRSWFGEYGTVTRARSPPTARPAARAASASSR